jgi:sugar lactone lactonase YvrE
MTKIAKSLVSALLLTGFLCPGVMGATVPQVTALGTMTDGVSTPVRVAVDQGGNYYVTDPRGGGVLKMSGSGRLSRVIRTARPPQGIAITAAGNLVVSQGDYAAILDTNGVELGRLGSGSGQFKMANGIAIDDAGSIYVVDSLDNCVQAFTATGAYRYRFGAAGSLAGQFSMPTGIAYEKSSGQLAVVDTLNGRVQFFDISGSYRKSIGSYGSGPLQFTFPQGIAFEYTYDALPALNRIYVVDSFQGNVQAVDPAGNGSFLAFIGSYGTAAGQLMVPSDLMFDQGNGRLVVANGFGNLALYRVAPDTAGAGTGSSPGGGAGTGAGAPPTGVHIDRLPAYVNSSVLTVTGTREATALVSLTTDNTAAAGAVTYPSDYTWESTVSGLVTGANTITASALNAAGVSSSASATVILDTTAPVLSVSALPDGSNAAAQVQNVSGLVADPNLDKVTVNGQLALIANGRFSAAVNLNVGANTIVVAASDLAGNVTTATRSLNFTGGGPALTVAAPADGILTLNSVLALSGTVAANSTVSVNGAPASVTGTQWSASVNLTAGVNTIAVTAVDLAGVASSLKRTVVLAAGGPELAVTGPGQDLATNAGSLTINGTASPGSVLSYAIGGVSRLLSLENGAFSFTLALTGEGEYPVTVSAADSAGNIAAVTRNVVYDRSPPALLMVPPGVPTPTLITGTVGLDALVTAADKNGAVGTPTVGAGAWSLDLAGITYDPATLAVTASDAAGNRMVRTLAAPVPTGDLDGDGRVTVADALRALRILMDLVTPTAADYADGDVGPLASGKLAPDGRIDLTDTILILRKAVGVESW